MKEAILTQEEQMLLALLRAALAGKAPEAQAFDGATPADWEQCYRLAARQGVRALAWDGLALLPPALLPPRALRLLWGADTCRVEEQHRRYCRAAHELTALFADNGIATVLMKGTGHSTCYPVPAHREGGDIDLYTYSADPTVLDDMHANRLADLLAEDRGMEVDRKHSEKHSLFYYKGIPVENHHTLLDTGKYRSAARLEERLHRALDPQPLELPDGGGQVWVPSPEFNTLFLAYHAIQHYGAGLSLHHLCDWACFVSRYGLRLPPDLDDAKFLGAVEAFTTLARTGLGVDVPDPGLPMPPGLDKKMLHEVLHSPFAREVPHQGKTAILWYKLRRMLHRLHVRQDVLDETLTRGIGEAIRVHWKNPETLFKR